MGRLLDDVGFADLDVMSDEEGDPRAIAPAWPALTLLRPIGCHSWMPLPSGSRNSAKRPLG